MPLITDRKNRKATKTNWPAHNRVCLSVVHEWRLLGHRRCHLRHRITSGTTSDAAAAADSAAIGNAGRQSRVDKSTRHLPARAEPNWLCDIILIDSTPTPLHTASRRTQPRGQLKPCLQHGERTSGA